MSDRYYINYSCLRENGCDVRAGAEPRNRNAASLGKEPVFDIRDAIPTSGHGERFLNREFAIIRDHERLGYQDQLRRPKQSLFHEQYMNDARGVDYDFNRYPDDIADALRYGTEGQRKRKQKKVKKMNEKQMLADSLLDNFNTIDVVFPTSMDSYDGSQKYTYKVPKDWEFEDAEEVEQFVVVPPGRGNIMRIARVVTVHDRAHNPDNIKLKWCVQQIDAFEHDGYVESDKKALQALMEVEKRKAKRELLEEFAEGLDKKEMKQLESDLGVELK